jgi:hypothetical protein
VFSRILRAPTRLSAARREEPDATLDHALARLMSRWRSQGVDPLPPVDEAEVRSVFERLGGVATHDVIALFAVVGGMRDMDDDYLRLWSLDEIAQQPPSDEGVLFADYLISCWDYRLSPTAGACSAVRVEDGRALRVGSTLEAFLVSYAQDPDFIHGFG